MLLGGLTKLVQCIINHFVVVEIAAAVRFIVEIAVGVYYRRIHMRTAVS